MIAFQCWYLGTYSHLDTFSAIVPRDGGMGDDATLAGGAGSQLTCRMQIYNDEQICRNKTKVWLAPSQSSIYLIVLLAMQADSLLLFLFFS